MSIFASRTQQTIPIPFDLKPDGTPHEVTIQKLAGRHIQKARDLDQLASIDTLKRMGGPKFQQELSDAGGSDPAVVAALVAKQQADPLHGYDRYTVLAAGIKSWTYEESLTPVEETNDDGTKTMRIPAIDDLDDYAADFLARAILALSPKHDEASQKNA